jgi:subtilisin family serine protease
LIASGFRVIRRTALASLGDDVVRLAVPRGQSLQAALREVRAAAPDAVTDLDHYYGLGVASRAKPKPDKSGRGPSEQTGPQHFTVGMIDTAVSPHPAMASTRLVHWSKGGEPAAAAQHGTAVASLMAERGPATIYSANIFRGPPTHPFTSIDIVAEAMEWLLAQGAPVINMSIAGPPNALLEKLVAIAGAHGRIIVAAAGNGGPAAPPVYPAALPGVFAVTAVDPALRVYRYANHGAYIAVAAQGVGVLAARAEGGYARFTGTSFAAPLVAARLARCRAAGASVSACKDQLLKAARDLGPPGFDDTYGHGYVE